MSCNMIFTFLGYFGLFSLVQNSGAKFSLFVVKRPKNGVFIKNFGPQVGGVKRIQISKWISFSGSPRKTTIETTWL